MLKILYFNISKELEIALDGEMRRTDMAVSSTTRPPARKLASRAVSLNTVEMPSQPETAKFNCILLKYNIDVTDKSLG
jgi:hypothetical protein